MYDENPEDMTQAVERTPQVSGIEDILLALKQKLALPMLPPGPPAGPPAGPPGLMPGQIPGSPALTGAGTGPMPGRY